jgi:hypothetical protein
MPNTQTPLTTWWHSQKPFQWVIAASTQFVVLTLVAMLFYPGGIVGDATTAGYAFSRNFFSDLGLTVAHNGASNWLSAVFFFIALSGAGLGIILLFLRLPPVLGYWWCWIGSLFGVIAGLSFIGVAFTPADLLLAAHAGFVYAAFLSFFVAALIYSVAILRSAAYPNGYAAVFGLFTLLLAIYIWVLFFGPRASTPNGLFIQVTGQKLIAYAGVIAVLIQAYGAQRVQE